MSDIFDDNPILDEIAERAGTSLGSEAAFLVEVVATVQTDRRRIAELEAEVAKARAEEREAPWFLLFDGQSADGMGEGAYVGRTTDVDVARRHYEKCRENPYSTGSVLIVTPTERTRARCNTKWGSYIQRRAREASGD